MMQFSEFMANQNQVAPQTTKWKASKEEIVAFWKNLRPDTPIAITPINPAHTGSTYGEDGLRITGSPQFITSVMARLKEFLNFETPSTKLNVSYRETEPQTPNANAKTSYVFYLQTKKRADNVT